MRGELLHLGGVKFSTLHKIIIYEYMGKVFSVEFQREPFWNSTQEKLSINWKIWFLYKIEILRALRFKSSWAFLKRLKSPASRLFTQPFIQAQMKENLKAPRHWPLCGEVTGDQLIPCTKDQ